MIMNLAVAADFMNKGIETSILSLTFPVIPCIETCEE
jgi:hypothetical protein